MTDKMVTCPNCGHQVYEHTLDMKCFAHVPNTMEGKQRAQEAERATVYRTEGEEYSDE